MLQNVVHGSTSEEEAILSISDILSSSANEVVDEQTNLIKADLNPANVHVEL
jgi:hypothetical protein